MRSLKIQATSPLTWRAITYSDGGLWKNSSPPFFLCSEIKKYIKKNPILKEIHRRVKRIVHIYFDRTNYFLPSNS